MKKNIKNKLIFLLMVPIIVSLIINLLLTIGIKIDSSGFLSIITVLIYVWQFTAILFWFYVGKQFGKLEISKMKSFILGNSLWMISLLLYIWQFILLDDAKRNLFIAVISQHYPLGFVSFSGKIIRLFTNTIHGTTSAIVSYIIMLIVFTIGFIYTPKSKYDKIDI